MIRFFRGSGAGPVFLLMLAASALWIGYIIRPPQLNLAADSLQMPLWALITQALAGSPSLAVIVSFTLLLAVAIIMIRFNTAIFFIPHRTVLPALIYILLYSVFPGEMIMNPALPASLLIVAGIWRMITSYRVNGMTFKFFDAALLISSAGLLYAGAVWFVLLVFIGALILRSPDMRELALALVGALLPWIVMYAVWYITGGFPGELTEIIRHNLFDPVPSVYWSRALVILLIILGLNFIPSLFSLVKDMPTYKIRSRKTWELFLWMIVICAAAIAFVPAVSAEIAALAAVPVSFIMAGYLTFTRRVATAEILLWLMIIMLVVTRLWPY
ncbi:MAG: hypothetical protein H6545_03335 [Bacteroidales bacterium]|jgi:hypothetical protein|nr:hypothetical protein [Bacteroidales bacterium]MCB9028135.1 hypothetical protein [Bacteroidales bacterium]MDD3736074.1 DUF6427 family protein [Bacteroidales bacterium]NLD62820.1 hypothetical protein [Bacteroidales bacterium]HNT92571.1 DUF6427 family protein [Bacteroidales bacterium]